MIAQPVKKIVAYYRLSKPKKGKNKSETIRDAYGLEDQRREVARIAETYDAEIIGEFQEIETGTNKKAHREELEKAILMAQMHKATLVVGKQDRLGRNNHFITGLMEKKIRFMCADAPDQSEVMIQIRAAIDEEEARRISERTRRANAIAKAKGVKLGSARPGHWKGREHLRRAGLRQATKASSLARTHRTKEVYGQLIGQIAAWNAAGVPLSVIAERLNKLGHVTMAAQPFHKVVVFRILKMFGIKPNSMRRVTVKCAQCDRELKVTWSRREAAKEKGDPIVCFRCAKEEALV